MTCPTALDLRSRGAVLAARAELRGALAQADHDTRQDAFEDGRQGLLPQAAVSRVVSSEVEGVILHAPQHGENR